MPSQVKSTTKPLVVGAPRSGFSLLIAVTSSIMNHYGLTPPKNLKDLYRDGMVQLGTIFITDCYQRAFVDLGLADQTVFNGEFHLLVGGPKWLDPENTQKACVRKYIGFKGHGDFLFVTKVPREMLEYHKVVHSHENPPIWCDTPYYDPFTKMVSIRNPVGIINSACFSLNAMASEYLQRFVENPDDTGVIRQRLGAFKLTDLNFMRGLVKYLTNYFDNFMPVKDQYFTLKWEDLISDPALAIQRVGRELGVDIPEHVAKQLWAPMDHKNLMRYHKHNYRKGKGIIGDWKNSLVNEHLEIFKEVGFNDYLKELGYGPIKHFNESEYSPYQKMIARYIHRGEIFQNTGDPDLFGMAYNKTNLDTSEMDFKSYPPRNWTHIERTTIDDDHIVEHISNEIENAYKQFFSLYDANSPKRWRSADDIAKLMSDLRYLMKDCRYSTPTVPIYHFIESLNNAMKNTI